MTIRATTDAEQAYTEIKTNLRELRRLADEWQNEMATDTGINNLTQMTQSLNAIRQRMIAVQSTPGLAQYAQTAENDPGYDVVAEWATLRDTHIPNAITNIRAVCPVSNTFAEAFVWETSGAVTQRIFTSVDLATARTSMQTLRDFITVS